jgi:hypothetical protein
MVLGNIIIKLLKLRKRKFKGDKVKFDEAENDEKQYNESIEDEKRRKVFDLSDDEKIELKKKFRKATVLCHPDKVSDEYKDAAQSIFIQLKAAYDANDLECVSNIVMDLEKGNYFKLRSETVNEKDLLKAAIAKLNMQINILENEIVEIKESDSYKHIININNWDEYFNNTKELLESELNELQNELSR